MVKRVFLKQAEGRKVPQENGNPWPEDGLEVEVTAYIRRRIKDEDLVASKKPSKSAAKPQSGDKK